MKITAGKYNMLNNYIQHLCNNQDRLYIMPDSVHVFKNVACSLTSGTKFYLNETLNRS